MLFVLLFLKKAFLSPLFPSSGLQQESLKKLTELLVLFGSSSNNTNHHTHLIHAKLGITLNQSLKFKLSNTGAHVQVM